MADEQGPRDRRSARGRGGGSGPRGGRGGSGRGGGARDTGAAPSKQQSKQLPKREEEHLRAPERRAVSQQSAQPKSEPIDRVGVSAALSREPEFAQYVSAKSMSILERASGAVPAGFRNDLLRLIDTDLKGVLRAPYRTFWSYVIHNVSFAKCLESYLRDAPRYYEPRPELPDDVAKIESSIRRTVLVIFLRIATLEESPECYWTRGGYENALQKRRLISVANLVDLCAVYAKTGHHVLPKIVPPAFQNLTYLRSEAREAGPRIAAAVRQLGDSIDSDSLPDAHARAFDMISSLRCFLITCPAEATVLCCEGGLLQALVECYQTTLPRFVAATMATSLTNETRTRHRKMQRSLGRLIAHIVQVTIADRLLDAENDVVAVHFDALITFLESTARHEYAEDDVIETPSLPAEVDKRIGLLQLLHRLRHVTLHSNLYDAEAMLNFHIISLDALVTPLSQRTTILPSSRADPTPAAAAASSASSSSVDPMRASLISSVKDLLPSLGDAFIDACLRHYKDNIEAVINAVLEESLPPRLAALDRTTGLPPQPSSKGKAPISGPWAAGPPIASPPSASAAPAASAASASASSASAVPEMRVTVEVTKRTRGRQDNVQMQLGLGEPQKKAMLKFLRGRTFDEDEDEYDDTYDSVDVAPLERDGGVFDAQT